MYCAAFVNASTASYRPYRSAELNSKFFSSFLSLNSVLLLTTFAITSDPLSLLPLSAISALPNAMIFSCVVLGQPWPTLGPLLLFVHHSGITSLLLRLFYLLPLPRLSLALSFYLPPGTEMHKSASVWLTP